MGQSESKQGTQEVSIEQLSHELALRFAAKCYSHLEIAHFKDNFKRLANHQDDIEYWKEETLCQFLSLPESLRAGSVLYAMITYLGAFPFPSLAPCIVTREAMLKVVTILTDRYKKILKRGDQDKIKLLFRSMAVFDRRASSFSPASKKMAGSIDEQETGSLQQHAMSTEKAQTTGISFEGDQPLDADEGEEDDDLALAALDALDAIEVFRHGQKQDRKIDRAHIPVENFKKIVALMLLLAPLTPLDNIAIFTSDLTEAKIITLENSTNAIVAAFVTSGPGDGGAIAYSRFVQTMTMLTANLFRPFNPLFEHFMYSRQLDLNKHKETAIAGYPVAGPRRSPISLELNSSSTILNDILLAQLSFSFDITSTSSPEASSFFHSSCHITQIYSTSDHGTSLSSFSRQVLSWRSASLLLLRGTHNGTTFILGAYLPDYWRDHSSTNTSRPSKQAILFQLAPRHAIFRANPYNTTIPTMHLSTKTGIVLGCVIPPSSKIHTSTQTPVPGPVSLLIDDDISTAVFHHDARAGTGAFLTDPLLEQDQRDNPNEAQAGKIALDMDELEVWGISFPLAAGEDEEDTVTKQKKLLKWQEEEAARRRSVNFGGDKDGARNLLEMAGIVGDGNRSGGSMDWQD